MRQKTTFDLKPEKIEMKPYKVQEVKIKDRTVKISKAPVEKVGDLIGAIKKKIQEDPDKYALVGGRVIDNLKRWRRGEIKNMFYFVARGDNGEILALSSGRVLRHKGKFVGLNYSTMAFEKGLELGKIMLDAKTEYFFDVMEIEEAFAMPETKFGRNNAERKGYRETETKKRHEWPSDFGSMILTRERYRKIRNGN